jgi:DASH complex subunit DAD2
MSYAHSRAYTASQIPPSLAHVEGIDQLTPSQVRLLEKQQEYHGLLELRRASLSMLERMEELARMSSVMADGGEAIGSVLRNWPHVFSILNLFREFSCLPFLVRSTYGSSMLLPTPAAMQAPTTKTSQDDDEPELKAQSIPPLVRIPYTQNAEQAEDHQ